MYLSVMLGANFFTTLANIFHFLGDILTALFEFLIFMPCILIFIGIVLIAAFAEIVFKKLAGIDTIYLNGNAFGGANDGGQDLVYAFITEPAVQDVFWSIVALSFVLLFIFTIVALIKSEFTLDLKGSAKGPIIGRALKSFANFIIVPVVTLISIVGTNYLTKTIYDLFGGANSSVITKCFYIGAYNANRARLSPSFGDQLRTGKDFDGEGIFQEGYNPFSSCSNSEQVAALVDKYFMDGEQTNTKYNSASLLDRLGNAGGWFEEGGGYINFSLLFFGYPNNGDFSMFNMGTVNFYYDLSEFDFILAVGSAVCMAWILLTTCLVLIKRVFELTILFLLSPVMTAIAPLDGGQAEKKWRQEFMKRLLAVIGPIFAFNMYFLLVPLFENISLFGGMSNWGGNISATMSSGGTMTGSIILILAGFYLIFDIFFQLVCVITGMSIVKSASGLLSNLLGIEDLVKSGGEAAKKAVDSGKKAFAGAAAIAMPALKGSAAVIRGIKNRHSEGGKSAKKAKEELGDAQSAADESQEKLDAAQSSYEASEKRVKNSKSYKENEEKIADLEKQKELGGGNLSEEKEAELKAALTKRGEMLSSKTLKDKRAALESAQKDADKAQTDLNFRKSGVSKEMQSKIEKMEAGRDEKGKFVNKEQAEENKKKAEELRKQAASGGIKGAWKAEFGKDSGQNSIFAETLGAGDGKVSKLYKKVFNGERFQAMDTMLKGLFLPDTEKNDGKSGYKRRLNDAMAGLFGDNGGGELWKIWFNKNSRAGLFENVPESKKRTEGIQQSLSWAARQDWQDKHEAKKKQEEEEKNIRRMLAEDKQSNQYLKLISQRDEAAAQKNEARVEKLDAQIKQFEAKSGLRAEAEAYYKALQSGDKGKQAKLAEYKQKMEDAAGVEAYDKDVKAKAKAKAAQEEWYRQNSSSQAAQQAQKTKTDADEKSKLAQALAEAMNNKFKDLKIDLKPEAIQRMFEGLSFGELVNAMQALTEALDKLKGE